MAQTYTDLSGIIQMVETPERKVNSLVKDACNRNSVTIMQQALALGSSHHAEINMEQLINRILRRVIEAGSIILLHCIISQKADVKIIPPTTIAWNWWNATDIEKKQEACDQTIKILEVLLDHGWDINTMQSVEYETTPLLWYVCGSPTLTRYCLDRGACLIITEERTSSNPEDTTADIYHTERHLLLLECAAAHSDIETFELLRSRDAPLVPGQSWPPWHAPCLLLRAVQRAAELAPRLQADATAAYLSRLSMVKHLLSIVGLPSHESDPHSWKIVDSELASPEEDYWPDEEEETDVTDLRELVSLLLTAHSNPEAFVHLDVESHVFEVGVASLDFLKCTMPIPFRLAFKHWQENYKSDWLSNGLSPSSHKLQQAAGVSRAMVSADKLSNLPNEVIDLIAQCLEKADVLQFRMVNRTMRDASFAAFKTKIRYRRVSLTVSALERLLEEFASDDHLIWHVQEVVFQAEDKPNREAEETRHIQNLLTCYLIASKTKGSLHGLVLDRVDDMLSCVLPALQRSKLALHKLSLFSNGGYSTASLDDFRNFAGIREFISSLSTLRHFIWTISNSIGSTDAVTTTKNIATIKQIFEQMKMLETLDLGWYKRCFKQAEVEFLDSCLGDLLTMTRLREIRLRGISASQSTLHKLVAQTTARRISLIHIALNCGGSFRPILDVLTSGRFDYFHLDELHASERANGLVRFIAPGPTTFPSESHCRGPFGIVRQGNEARRHIEFNIDTGRILSSGAWQRHCMRSLQIYGQYSHMN